MAFNTHVIFFSLFLFYSDISMRGRDIEGVIKQYSSMVKPAYCNYIAPTMVHADIIVPRGGDNKVAIQLIVQHVHSQLQLVCTINININNNVIDFRWHDFIKCVFSHTFIQPCSKNREALNYVKC